MGTTTKKRKFARLMKDTFLQKAKIHWLPGVDYVTVVNPKVTFINTLGYLVHYFFLCFNSKWYSRYHISIFSFSAIF